jgi:hypothetical protein
MWQSPPDSVELLLQHYAEGATVRNQYGSLPLHMAASNQASVEVVKLLIEAYPDALHLQNDDGMTPLDLALGDESASEAIIALLEGRPAPPELSLRQKAEKFMERADALERKLVSLRGSGGRQGRDFKDAVAAVRRLADCYPQALYSAGIDPNELEIALSNAMVAGVEGSGRRSTGTNAGDAARKQQMAVENAILDAVKKRDRGNSGARDRDGMEDERDDGNDVRDRVEDLISSIVGLEHVKCQVSVWQRSATSTLSFLRWGDVPFSIHLTLLCLCLSFHQTSSMS